MVELKELVLESAPLEYLLRIAAHFDRNGNYCESGSVHLHCKLYSDALRLFMRCAYIELGQNPAVSLAIETVKQANQEKLTHTLIEYLTGSTDGVIKEAKYIFELHMAIQHYEDAAKTAMVISREYQDNGNYRSAREMLLKNHIALRNEGLKVPLELESMLMIVHSYLTVKQEDHETAARILVKVTAHISKFPLHAVQIRTSTIIECLKAGLKKTAYDNAVILCRPENRNLVDQKYRKKIESLVRRPDQNGDLVDLVESCTPCPMCGADLANTCLDCAACKNIVPYCVVSARHMVKEDRSKCNECQLPALYSQLKRLAEASGCCPMCSKAVDSENVILL